MGKEEALPRLYLAGIVLVVMLLLWYPPPCGFVKGKVIFILYRSRNIAISLKMIHNEVYYER